MTIIVFLVDTSASMTQRTYLGARLSVLDVAKDAVERFLKIRQKDQASRQDRYMLLTFEESPNNIKAGWKENHMTFLSELKNLQANGLTSTGAALKNAFDLLNMNRMQSGIDTYGQGRCPFYLEPSMIVVLTDGNKITSQSGVLDQLNLPMHSLVPGSELTKEPFRWDQRIFSLVLRLPATAVAPPATAGTTFTASAGGAPPDTVPLPDVNTPLNDMCEVTGGRSYSIASQRQLVLAIENLVQSVQPGVVINFEKIGPDPPPLASSVAGEGDENVLRNGIANRPSPTPFGSVASLQQTSGGVTAGVLTVPACSEIRGWQSCRKLIYVQRSVVKGYSVGHWPLPEAFWPDHNSPALPPRTAHPLVRFTCSDAEPMAIESLPFDKYELEPSPLTQYILARRQPTVAWQVFVANSHRNTDLGCPFGYLKASTTLTCVNLFVMPYNYPVLLPLLDDLFKLHRLKPPPEWRDKFQEYLHNMPVYYAGPLKRALQRMGAPNLVPEHLEGQCLNSAVVTQLKKLKNQAKAEFEKLCSLVGSGKRPLAESMRVTPGVQRPSGEMPKLTDLQLTYSPALKDRFLSVRSELSDFPGFQIAVQRSGGFQKGVPQGDMFRNPFDIPRSQLLNQIRRMRANLMHLGTIRLQDDDALHSLPIGQMGNYQEHLKRQTPPLREIESAPVRQHMFGNPFKIDKRMMVDEADAPDPVGLANSTSSSSGGSIGPTGPVSLGPGGSRKRAGTGSPADLSGTPVGGRPKRAKGPLPKDLVLRPRTPSQNSCSVPLTSSPSVTLTSSSSSSNFSLSTNINSSNSSSSKLTQINTASLETSAASSPGASTNVNSIHNLDVSDSNSANGGPDVVEVMSPIDCNGVAFGAPPAVNSITGLAVNTQHPLMQLVNTPSHSTLIVAPLSAPTGAASITPAFVSGTLITESLPLPQSQGPQSGNSNGTLLPTQSLQHVSQFQPSPFARGKTKGTKLLNGFAEDKKEIIIISKEECDKITAAAIKFIRKPGKDFAELFVLLADVRSQPSFPVIIQRLILEANRFKRKHLAEQLARQMSNAYSAQTSLLSSLSSTGPFASGAVGASLGSSNSHTNLSSIHNNGFSFWRLSATSQQAKR